MEETIMAFTVKLATYDDLKACDAVERETMGDYVYLTGKIHLKSQYPHLQTKCWI